MTDSDPSDADMLDAIIQQCRTIMQDTESDSETRFKAQSNLMKAVAMKRKLFMSKKPGSAFDVEED